MDLHNPVIQQHLEQGGRAYVRVGGWIEERHGVTVIESIAVIDQIPATLGGTPEFQVSNVLAATAVARAYGLPVQQIADALRTFRTERDSVGRLNVYAFRGGYVVIDYGHNPVAIRCMRDMVANWNASRRTAVIAIPGDRRTDLIMDSARMVAHGYDRVYVREDKDLRGRQPGEVARILSQTRCDQLKAAAEPMFNLREHGIVLVAAEGVVVFGNPTEKRNGIESHCGASTDGSRCGGESKCSCSCDPRRT
ncbi:MAG: hypothetical protein JOZ62_01990 [Acidobacteriaceae bacterium]|nr:hypothetical protein [Acidobacteriaceae bacterium]